nr:hypothetical protein [Tanacetum cinerariifolium]
MNNLEKQLNNEILHGKDFKSALSVIKVKFDKFKHFDMLKPFDPYSNSASYDRENGLKRLNERKLQIQNCKVQEVKASGASSGDKDCHRIVLEKGNDQGLDNQSNTYGDESNRSMNECNDKSTSGNDTDIIPSYDTEPMVKVPYTVEYNVFVVDTQHSEEPECIINTCVVEKLDTNVIPDSPDMCDNEIQTDHNAVECDDERLVKEKTKVITDLKLKEEKDIDKMISMEKQLKFLNEIVYKRNQSIQTIHMLPPEGPTFNGRPTFANPRELVDQAWVKHSHDHFRAPTALDVEVLIKTCLMPLSIKIQNDSFTFVHELKQEMHADLKYVESLENEIDELKSDKAEFLNMYDILLQECVSNDVMCAYLHSLSGLDANTELQGLYLYQVKECECLAKKLSK